MAHAIKRTGRPAIILAPNETLAAQLFGEMRSFFPENAVEYFVSYYNYYQLEALCPADRYLCRKGIVAERADRPDAPLGDAGHSRAALDQMMRQATTAEVRLKAGNAERFSASARQVGYFDRLLPT